MRGARTKALSVFHCGVQLHRKYEVTGQFRVKLINFNSPPPLLITHKGINLLGDYITTTKQNAVAMVKRRCELSLIGNELWWSQSVVAGLCLNCRTFVEMERHLFRKRGCFCRSTTSFTE